MGQLTIEADFLKKNLGSCLAESDRRAAVERWRKDLSVKRQCELLSISRNSAYREKSQRIPNLETIEVMNQIDAIHTAHPSFGYRKITDVLRRDMLINQKRVHRLMQQMDIITIYPKPNLSKRFHAQYVRPYLLRNLEIIRPNQVRGWISATSK